MGQLYLYNAYIPRPISTTHYRFEPVDNFEEGFKNFEQENRHSSITNFRSTKVFENTNLNISHAYFYPSQPKIWDYCAMLSLFQARTIFPFNDVEEGSDLFVRIGKTSSWSLLLAKEIEAELDDAVKKLDSFSDRERYIFVKSLAFLFEGELFTHYSDFKDVWYLQPLELFCKGIYCLDHNVTNHKNVPGNLKYKDYLKYAVQKYGFETQYTNSQSIEQFLKNIVDVRNWVMHGKVWECNVFNTRAEEFTFYHRVEALLKAFLFSYLDINKFENRDALIHGIALGNAITPIWVKD